MDFAGQHDDDDKNARSKRIPARFQSACLFP